MVSNLCCSSEHRPDKVVDFSQVLDRPFKKRIMHSPFEMEFFVPMQFKSFSCFSRTAQRARTHGFTLIEIMVVIVILGILAALVVPRIMSRPDEARAVAAKQ